MTPDASWPNIPSYGLDAFTPADHAAHTSPKGIPNPSDLIPGMDPKKMGKIAMKFVKKPHLSTSPRKSRARPTKRKKK